VLLDIAARPISPSHSAMKLTVTHCEVPIRELAHQRCLRTMGR
jgi:hypothetical protein